ncbi:MAG TPA: M48 family metallopeptidase [Verrucomicrobiae bacterium]|jgi:predicted Zn-dependent protease|nr:M48 family metallopeptidase [Verrucomicrobiae bacterium]
MFPRFSMLFCMLVLACSLCFAQTASSPSASPSASNDKPAAGSDQDDKSVKDDKSAKDDDIGFKPGSGINDVNSIGRRNVGCDRGFANWYSLESQVAMGRQFAQQVDQTSKLITDPKVNEYVNRIGQNLVRNSDSKLPFTIKILDDETPNAFTLPGGFMYVNSGAILTADNEAELAGVMAHEIGHVAACHIARQNTRGALAQIATIPLIFLGGPLVNLGISEAMNLAVPATFMKFSRNFEAQADYLGVQYAYKAGYDPVGMINFFERIEALDKKKKGFITKAYESHPQTPDRMAKSEKEIASILPARDQYIVDTSDFQATKARLAAVLNKHKLPDEKEEHPNLRRTADAPSNDKNPKDDDRPTIKRRPSSPNEAQQ